MDKIAEMQKQLGNLLTEAKGLKEAAAAEKRDLTDEESKRADELLDEVEKLKAEIKDAEAKRERQRKLDELAANAPSAKPAVADVAPPAARTIPASVRIYRTKVFTDENDKLQLFTQFDNLSEKLDAVPGETWRNDYYLSPLLAIHTPSFPVRRA